MEITFDPVTRVEYIVSPNGSLQPRYNADGSLRLHPMTEQEELDAIDVTFEDIEDTLPDNYDSDDVYYAIEMRQREILAERRAARNN